MNLHDQIMNIHATGAKEYDETPNLRFAYKKGHRDARHAAAELALPADREPVRLSLEEVLHLTRPDESRPMHQAEYMRFARDIETAVLKANGLLD